LKGRPLSLSPATTLVLAPHPDDEALGCGGVIAWARQRGFPVQIVFLTDGAASHPNHPRVSPAELAQLRRREALESCAALGVEPACIQFLDIPDGTLSHLSPTIRQLLVERLVAILLKESPAYIFLPLPNDGSSEHNVVNGFLQDALDSTGQKPVLLHYPVWAAWRPQLLLRPALSARSIWCLRLGELRSGKQAALNQHHTQVAPLSPWTRPELSTEFQELLTSDWEFFFQW
jgi:LmbE family N-acetylglucosaminyl deacetylase